MAGLTEALDALETPCALLDRARVTANCDAMRARADALGVRLRPHLKTAKCAEVARLAGGEGITVSTLEEARYFAERGFRDQTYAVGITPDKLARVAAIDADVAVLTDDVDVAHAAAAAGLPAWIEIDSGQGRGGLAPDDPRVVACARALGERLRGVLTHAGHSYGGRSVEAIRAVAEAERAAAVDAAERVRAAGVPCPGVSVGSTPTAVHAARLDGVTELRAGVYVFFDRFQLAIGSCGADDLALSVLASVVSRRDGAVWIDAGTLGLSSERSMDPFGGGYGVVTAADGAPLPGDPYVDALNQVHGRVVARDGALPALPVGARVRVWPNHACITAAMYDAYEVVDDDRVVDRWPRLRG
ncbi:MAG: alanine racemase [Sandaracinaceae bacterium]|nr:alanine racemase [Sandaracinaceae bacterium]